jgi:hypothetical protein
MFCPLLSEQMWTRILDDFAQTRPSQCQASKPPRSGRSTKGTPEDFYRELRKSAIRADKRMKVEDQRGKQEVDGTDEAEGSRSARPRDVGAWEQMEAERSRPERPQKVLSLGSAVFRSPT